jgi:hypothetical protein
VDLTQQILLGVAIPAFVAALLWASIWRPWAPGAAAAPRAGGSIAVAAGVLAGYVALLGFPNFPPASASEKIPFIVAAAGALGMVEGRIAGAIRSAHLYRIALSAAIVGYLLQAMIAGAAAGGWFAKDALLALGAAALAAGAIAAIWGVFEAAAGLGAPFVGVWIWLATLGGESFVLLNTGNAMMAQFAGAAAASLAPGFVIALWRGAPTLERGTLAAVVPAAGAFALVGRYFGELTDLPLVLVALAPIVGFGFLLASERGGARAPLLRAAALGAPLAPLGIAVWLTGGLRLPGA